jgi:hypothetical protein
VWLPQGAERVRLIEATRFKTAAGSGEDVGLHHSSDLRAGRMEQVQLTDRHHGESLTHFRFQAGDLVGTDAGSRVGSSREVSQQSQSVLLQRPSASPLHLEEEQGPTISLKESITHLPATRGQKQGPCVQSGVGLVGRLGHCGHHY